MSVNVDTASDNVLLLVNGTYTPATGFRLNWVVSDVLDPSSVLGNPTPTLALDTIQNIIIPNGALTADQDIVSGIAIIKRQDNSPDVCFQHILLKQFTNSQFFAQDVHIDSLAVILPDSTPLSPVHTWHYISDLKHILSTQTDVEIRRQAAISWYSTNVVRKRGRSVRMFDPKTVTWEEQLADSSYHPLHNLPLFLRIFGPSFVTVYKYVLARHRVVIYLPPGASNNIPSQESHKAKDDISVSSISDRPAESEDPASNSGKATDTAAPLLARPCELASSLAHIFSALCGGKDRPCALGFLDGSSPHNALFDDSLDSGSGWVACTSERRFLLSHLHEIDLVVDLSPIYNSSSLIETETSTATAISEGIKLPLLLVPSFSSSTPSTASTSSLQLRPTRFTLLDIQLWSDIQGVMKRIERAKQRELRRPIMNGSKNMKGRNGSLQEKGSISDSDWDDNDFAVPGGWNSPNTNGNTFRTEDSSAKLEQGVPASSDSMTVQEVIHPYLQPPPLPQKLTYTLDLITAFHRHVVSLSKSYATMATTNGSHLPSSFPLTSANTQSPCLPHIEFDDLEKLFLEGGRRRRDNLLNGILEPPSAVHGLTSNLVARNTSTSAAINGKEINGNTAVDNLSETTVSTASISSSTISPPDRRISMQSERRSPTPTPLSFSKVAANALRSLSRSPPRSHPSSKIRVGSRSRSSSRESERTALVFVDASQVQANVNHNTSQSHQPPDVRISPTPSSPPGSYSPPPYPYVYSNSYPRRPDTATSFSSIPTTSQFVTPEHSPLLTARNSPMNMGIGSLDGTPKVTGMKVTNDHDVELLVLNMPEPVLPPASFAPGKEKAEVEEGLGKENGQKKEAIMNGESDKITHDNDKDEYRNSISFPSPISASAVPPTESISPNTSKKSFSHKRSYSDDVSHNPPQLPVSGIVSGRESPLKPSAASSSSLLKKEKHLSGTLPTDSQLLEVEAELREQEARMLAPSPTPPALASPVLGPRKVKGWSAPASVFLRNREKEELAESDDSEVKVTQVPTEEQKGDTVNNNAGEKEREGGVDRNLVLTPVEVLWERRREGSASPSKDIVALTSSVPPAPPPTPLPSSAPTMATLPPYLFSPQPLPPGAAAPSPNVGPVITSIIDALRGAIALNGSGSPSPDATNGNIHTYDRDSPPLTPPPPLLSAYSNSSSSPVRTPTPQSLSGRETPRGLPKIDEEEEEESVNGDGFEDRKRVSLLRHRPPLVQGHATDSGDADAEGPDDGETGSMASSTAAGSVSLSPNPPGLSLGADETRSSPSLILPPPLPSPGLLSTTTTASAAVSATSIPLSPSPQPFAPSPSPSPSPSGLTISPPSALKPKPASNTSTPNSSPQKTIKSPVSKKSGATVRGHAASSSMSNPPSASSSSSSSLISNLTKSLSLKIRPRRLSLLSSSSKKGDDSTVIKDGVTTTTDEEEKKNEVMNRKSRSVPNTIGSSTGSMSSSPSMSSSVGSNTTSPTSLSLSNSTSPSTSLSSVNSGNNNVWIKSPRIRARATTSSGLPSSPSSSSKEPVFNMVTLMSAEDGSVEEWNGRNSGIGTLALANEMKRVQEESKLKGGVNSVVVVGEGGGGESDDVVNWNPLENAAIESDPPAAQVSPVAGLSSSKLAPAPKKGILRIRRASLTSLPPPEPVRTVAESSSGRNSSMSVSSSVKLGDGKQHPSPTSTPPRDQKKSKSTPTLKPKSMSTEVVPVSENKEDSSSIRIRKDSLGLIKKGKGLINVSTPPPPVPSLPNSSESTTATTTNVESGIQSPVIMVRSNTPDSTRRKLRKRRKSLVEPLAATATATDG
ncbi:hypothetical protein Clacol_007136 [Clathrus columnatus]|uniref:Uncharacterized protein n=1 Tax=Clathrus columnatus TaxID=1419009 RepID=A0AAV5AJ55_9AGAM|nr:hypothetical protein Clacol_007136 [Clathrus columnatus]